MKQVKIFTDSIESALEEAVNDWLSAHPFIKVLSFIQTESYAQGWSITITIFYDDPNLEYPQ